MRVIEISVKICGNSLQEATPLSRARMSNGIMISTQLPKRLKIVAGICPVMEAQNIYGIFSLISLNKLKDSLAPGMPSIRGQIGANKEDILTPLFCL